MGKNRIIASDESAREKTPKTKDLSAGEKKDKKPEKKDFQSIQRKNNFWIAFGAILLLTVATRYYKVTEPDHIW